LEKNKEVNQVKHQEIDMSDVLASLSPSVSENDADSYELMPDKRGY
jgi:hypothetical protein